MRLGEIVELSWGVGLDDVLQTEDDCEVGDEGGEDGAWRRERCLALHVVGILVREFGEWDHGKEEISKHDALGYSKEGWRSGERLLDRYLRGSAVDVPKSNLLTSQPERRLKFASTDPRRDTYMPSCLDYRA